MLGLYRLSTGVEATLRAALKRLTRPYRPERHYMRGPGPRALAKRDVTQADTPQHSAEAKRTA